MTIFCILSDAVVAVVPEGFDVELTLLLLLLVGEVNEGVAAAVAAAPLPPSELKDNFPTPSVATPKSSGDGISFTPPLTGLDVDTDAADEEAGKVELTAGCADTMGEGERTDADLEGASLKTLANGSFTVVVVVGIADVVVIPPTEAVEFIGAFLIVGCTIG